MCETRVQSKLSITLTVNIQTWVLDIIGDGANVKCNDQETEQWYHSGESWDRDNCTKCVCFEGEISCSALVCTNQKCSNPIVEEKNCCPVCLDKQEKSN